MAMRVFSAVLTSALLTTSLAARVKQNLEDAEISAEARDTTLEHVKEEKVEMENCETRLNKHQAGLAEAACKIMRSHKTKDGKAFDITQLPDTMLHDKGVWCKLGSYQSMCGLAVTAKGFDCFPAEALVDTPQGTKAMSELRVGDAVRSVDSAGLPVFEEVYSFGHADASTTAEYVNLKLTGDDRSLQLSQKHFLPTCPEKGIPCEWAQHIHAYAMDVEPGTYIWTTSTSDRTKVSSMMVQEASVVLRRGLYNPYTLSGKILVNGVLASAHSEWILDALAPKELTKFLPAVYQVALLPARWFYQLAGSAAADMLDMNNPQITAQGYGPHFLTACLMGMMLVVSMFSSKPVQ